MKIWPLVITIPRDFGLYGLLEKSLRKMTYPFERTFLSIEEGVAVDGDTKAVIDRYGVEVTRRKLGYGNWNN